MWINMWKTDNFTKLFETEKLLYFYLLLASKESENNRVSNPLTIAKLIDADEDNLYKLEEEGFIEITNGSGLIVFEKIYIKEN